MNLHRTARLWLQLTAIRLHTGILSGAQQRWVTLTASRFSRRLHRTRHVRSQALNTLRARSQANGRMRAYEIYVSSDGQNARVILLLGTVHGQYCADGRQLPATEGKFVKLVGLDAQNGKAFGGAGEVRLGGTCGEVDPTPGDDPTDEPSEDPQPKPTPKSNGKVSLDKEIVERGSSLSITGSGFARGEAEGNCRFGSGYGLRRKDRRARWHYRRGRFPRDLALGSRGTNRGRVGGRDRIRGR